MDAATALLVETNGTAKVAGHFFVYFVTPTQFASIDGNGKLTMNGIKVRSVKKGEGTNQDGTFNLYDGWDVSKVFGLQYTLTVTSGVMTSDRGDIYRTE